MVPALLALPALVVAAAAPLCPPAALLEGTGTVVGAVRKVLVQRGLEARGVSGCPAVRVHLARARRGISVAIEDVYGRRIERKLSSAEAVGALIESWATPALEVRSEPVAVAETPAALTLKDEPPPARVAPAAAANANASQLFAQAESSMDTDGVLWMGVRLGACVAVGPACVTAQARYATDGWGPMVTRPASLLRTDWEGLLGVALPLRLRGVRLTPTASAGLGWVHSRTKANSPDASQEAPDSSDDDVAPRVEVSLTAVWPLAQSLSLAALAAVDASASGATVNEGGAVVQAGGYFRIGVGLAWGAP
jgi:hypothetical protein